MKTETLVNSNNQTVLSLLNQARKTNESGGINVDDLQKRLNLSRVEVIEQCRDIQKKDVALKVGRRGGHSLLLFGQAAIDFNANRKSQPKQIITPTSKSEKSPFNFARFHLGNQTIDVPIDSMELLAA